MLGLFYHFKFECFYQGKMKISIFIFVLILNVCVHAAVLKINSISTSSPCEWNGDCEIRCLNGENSTNSYMESIQSVYVELTDECHTRGIRLIVPKDYFPNKTLKPRWLPVDNLKIIDLFVDFDNIRLIEQYAFGEGQFADVKKFVVRNLWPQEYLYAWTFDGLVTLENVTFLDAQLAVNQWGGNLIITYGMLQFAKDTLNAMTLTERVDEYHRPFSIQRMLGYFSETLSNVEYVNVKYNLTTINSNSFTAIPYVKVLDLSECYISSIGADSFDNMNKTLLTLHLENNRLVTLPEGIFMTLSLIPTTLHKDEIFVNSGTSLTIYLGDNPWHCDCNLSFTKDLLNQYSNFEGDLLCESPPEIGNYPIKESVFCPNPMTTTTSISTEISETTEINETYSDNFTEEECLSSEEIAKNHQSWIKVSSVVMVCLNFSIIFCFSILFL